MLVRARGREYFYHQRNRGTKRAGPRTLLAGCPFNPDGSPNDQWWTAYRELEGLAEPAARAGSFLALIGAREISPEWAALSENTRTEWKRYHGIIGEAWGHLDVKALEPKHVKALRDKFADIPPADPELRTKPLEEYKSRPAAANNLLRALSAAIAWGVPDGWRSDNPALLVPKLKGGDGYLPWPMRAIDHYQKHGKAHLWWVAAHALYTGQRQGDVLAMLKSDIGDGEIRVIQEKTRKPLWIPLHRDLRAVQATMREETVGADMPRLSRHLLVNTHGTEWTSDGFKSSWQTEMQRREFAPFKRHRLVFHGLRKSAVVFLLEAGCTTAEVSSITGQSMQMVEHYAEAVNQRKLARAAILKWENAGARKANNEE
jgi:integrase